MLQEIRLFLLNQIGAGSLFGTGEMESFHCQSWLPLWWLPLLVALVIVVPILLYRRETGLTAFRKGTLSFLRTLFYLLLLLLVFAPFGEITGRGGGVRSLPIVVDWSRSMTIRDGSNGVARAEIAKTVAERLANEKWNRIEPEIFSAGKQFVRQRPVEGKIPSGEPDGESTSLADQLSKALEYTERKPAGVVLCTDGADHSGVGLGPVLREYKRRNIPVFPVPMGSDDFRDVSVSEIRMDSLLFVNEKYRADVRLSQRGFSGRKVPWQASVSGEPIFEEHVEVAFTDKAEMTLPVVFTPAKPGVYELQITVTNQPGEASPENNRLVRNFRVIDQKLRVLLAFRTPSWEYRYLSGLFSRDHRVECQHYLEELDARRLREENAVQPVYLSALPNRAEDLNEKYDLVILSGLDLSGEKRPFANALAEFVERYAGGVVISSDPTFLPGTLVGSALEKALPIRILPMLGRSYADELDRPKEEPLHFLLTDEGAGNELLRFSADPEKNRELWKKMPPVYRVFTAGKIKPGATQLLATFQNGRRQRFPGILHSRYGRGNLIFLGFDSTWRWRREVGNRYFREFWMKAVQFAGLTHLLRESKQSELSVSDENAHAGEKVLFTARVLDGQFHPVVTNQISVTVHSPGAQEKRISLSPVEGRSGLYTGAFTPDEAGLFTATLPDWTGASPFLLRVAGARGEFFQCERNLPLLQKMAEETGGTVLNGAENAASLRESIALGEGDVLVWRGALWDTPLLLVFLFFVLGMEWILRKWWVVD